MVSFSELLSNAGAATGDFLIDAGNAIADKYCEVYRDYPQFIVGFGTDPITPFRRAMVDSLCNGRDPGLPPSPVPPFTGGQCQCVRYLVEVDVEFFDGSTSLGVVNSAPFLFGKIGGLRVAPIPGQSPALQISCHGSAECGEQEWFNLIQSSNFLPPYSYKVLRIEVTPQDGSPDVCGDPDPDFPTVTPPPEALKPPIPYTPPSGAPSFNIPVVFVPVTNNLNIPVNLDLDVDFNFNFDAGGLNFDFGGGGGGDGSFTPADRDALTQAANNAGQAANNAGGAKDAADAANDAANAAKDAANAAKDAADRAAKNTEPPPDPNGDEVDKEDRPSDDNDRDGIENLLYVKITLTQLPSQGKIQFGEGAPNVYYAGWFEWKFGGFPTPREPIHFNPTIFVAPKGADGYAYTLVNNAEGFATEITRKIEV